MRLKFNFFLILTNFKIILNTKYLITYIRIISHLIPLFEKKLLLLQILLLLI